MQTTRRTALKVHHAKSFETRTIPLEASKDLGQRTSARFDNKVLQAQGELVGIAQRDELTLSEFSQTAKDLESFQAEHASYRGGGFERREFTRLEALFKRVGQSQGGQADPLLAELFQALQEGTLSKDQLVEELNWRSCKSYGEALEKREVIHKDERYKYRVHLNRPKARKAKSKTNYRHPKFEHLIQTTMGHFAELDSDGDGIVNRLEARRLVSDYQQFELTPAEAVTLYSRQKHLASALEPDTSGENLKLEDLRSLLREELNDQQEEVVTKVSKRLRHQENLEQADSTSFKLAEDFQAKKVRQGKEGSCWLLCNLPALTEEQLSQVVQEDGEGYRVTLADGRTTYVDGLNEAERRLYSHGAGAWSGILEKGVAQILEQQGEDLNAGFPRVAREMLTGIKSRYTSIQVAPTREHPDLRNPQSLLNFVDQALELGSAVLCGANKSDFEKGVSEISAANHAYTVLDVNREEGTIKVRNPWGQNERADRDGTNDGIFELNKDQFFANFSKLYVDEPVLDALSA